MSLQTAEQVAKQLRCSEITVRRLVKRGEIHAVRVGRLLRFPEDTVAQFLAPKKAAER